MNSNACVKCLFPGCTDRGDRLRKGDGSSLPQRALGRAKEIAACPAAAGSTWISVSLCSPLEGCPAYKKQKVTEDFRASQELLCDPEALPCALCLMYWQGNRYLKGSSPD